MQSNANQMPAPQGPIDRPRSVRWKLFLFTIVIIALGLAARIAFWLPEEYRLIAHAVIIFSACHVSFMLFARPNASRASIGADE
jgi:hypothetical protein